MKIYYTAFISYFRPMKLYVNHLTIGTSHFLILLYRQHQFTYSYWQQEISRWTIYYSSPVRWYGIENTLFLPLIP